MTNRFPIFFSQISSETDAVKAKYPNAVSRPRKDGMWQCVDLDTEQILGVGYSAPEAWVNAAK